jgi:hypothetical protein
MSGNGVKSIFILIYDSKNVTSVLIESGSSDDRLSSIMRLRRFTQTVWCVTLMHIASFQW